MAYLLPPAEIVVRLTQAVMPTIIFYCLCATLIYNLYITISFLSFDSEGIAIYA